MANVTDKIVSAAPVWTGQLASSIPDGTTTSFSLTSSSGLTDGEVYYFTIDRVDASGNKTPAKKEVIKGKLNGTNVVDCIRGVEGTAQAHSSGATVEIIWTAAQWNSLKSHITTEHNQDGTHDETKVAMLAGAQTFTGQKTFSGGIKTDTIAEATTGAKTTISNGIKTDTIDEKTTAAGVTVDGLLIKDGALETANSVKTAAILAENVTKAQQVNATGVVSGTGTFDIPNMSITFTPAVQCNVLCLATLNVGTSNSGKLIYVKLVIDTVTKQTRMIRSAAAWTDGSEKVISIMWVENLTADSHTVKLTATADGAETVYVRDRTLIVCELKR